MAPGSPFPEVGRSGDPRVGKKNREEAHGQVPGRTTARGPDTLSLLPPPAPTRLVFEMRSSRGGHGEGAISSVITLPVCIPFLGLQPGDTRHRCIVSGPGGQTSGVSQTWFLQRALIGTLFQASSPVSAGLLTTDLPRLVIHPPELGLQAHLVFSLCASPFYKETSYIN